MRCGNASVDEAVTTERPLADQNGICAPSVPAMGCAERENSRSHNCGLPLDPLQRSRANDPGSGLDANDGTHDYRTRSAHPLCPQDGAADSFKATPEHTPHRCRSFGRELGPVRVALENRGQGVGNVLTAERSHAGDHLVKYASKRPAPRRRDGLFRTRRPSICRLP